MEIIEDFENPSKKKTTFLEGQGEILEDSRVYEKTVLEGLAKNTCFTDVSGDELEKCCFCLGFRRLLVHVWYSLAQPCRALRCTALQSHGQRLAEACRGLQSLAKP